MAANRGGLSKSLVPTSKTTSVLDAFALDWSRSRVLVVRSILCVVLLLLLLLHMAPLFVKGSSSLRACESCHMLVRVLHRTVNSYTMMMLHA